ncbi:hypothetical protein MLGJGCBP_03534 [Rhodococcus sp. T7]|nr:hypothetical protein MLGJGCBP_10030 [Rhodococcus sp. T7]KAF0963336.1 hypothetical protein MLGJGCBP_03534 [Rhodococcus sp. T7]
MSSTGRGIEYESVIADVARAVVAAHPPGRAATLAVPSLTGQVSPDEGTVTVTPNGVAWVLSGQADVMPGAATADLLLGAARTDAGVALFAVDAAERGVSRTPLSTSDLTSRQASVGFTDVPGRPIADEVEALRVLTHALRLAQTLLAAQQIGRQSTRSTSKRPNRSPASTRLTCACTRIHGSEAMHGSAGKRAHPSQSTPAGNSGRNTSTLDSRHD